MLSNLEQLKAALKKLPNATHAYLRREDGVTVDVPIGQAEFTIRNKHKWTFENLAVSDVKQSPRINPWPSQKISDIGTKQPAATAPEAAPVEVPPKPSEEQKPVDPAPSTDGQTTSADDQKPAETDTLNAPAPQTDTSAAPAAAPAAPARSTRSRAR